MSNPRPILSNRQLKAIGILILVVIALAALGALQRAVFDDSHDPLAIIMTNTFADMNDDGMDDYVPYAEVVLRGQNAMPPTQVPVVPQSNPVPVAPSTGGVSVAYAAPKTISAYTEEDWAAIDAGQLVPHPRREPDRLVTVKVSWYDPALGGVNCAPPCDRTANGSYVPEWYEKGAACAQSWPFGTVFEIQVNGQLRRFVCIDRGGAIVESSPGVFWVDLLLHQPVHTFGSQWAASVWFPQ